MFNFRSLLINQEDEEKARGSEHIENAEEVQHPASKLASLVPLGRGSVEGNRSRGDSGESSSSAPPPIYVELPPLPGAFSGNSDDQITPAPIAALTIHDPDKKWAADMDLLDHGHVLQETTQ